MNGKCPTHLSEIKSKIQLGETTCEHWMSSKILASLSLATKETRSRRRIWVDKIRVKEKKPTDRERSQGRGSGHCSSLGRTTRRAYNTVAAPLSYEMSGRRPGAAGAGERGTSRPILSSSSGDSHYKVWGRLFFFFVLRRFLGRYSLLNSNSCWFRIAIAF